VECSGARVLAEALKAERVRYVFGMPGGQSVDILYDGLYDVPEIRSILVRHEEAAAFMAYAYARLTGEPGVCSATVGPGAQHLIAGFAEAWSGCIPLIALCPQVSTKIEGMGALQEFSQVPVFSSFTKWSQRIGTPDRIGWYVRRAFQIACTGKQGPVFLEIPYDVGSSKLQLASYVPSIRPLRIRPSSDAVRKASELILASERPVIVAGGGVYLSRAFEQLLNFAEALAIPVLTSASGKGSLPEDHPLSAGCIGLYRNDVGKKVWDETDLVLGVGTRFEEMESAGWAWFPENAKLVQLDIDPAEIGRNWVPDLAIIGDAKLALEDLTEHCISRVGKSDYREHPRVKEVMRAKLEFETILRDELSKQTEHLKVLAVMRGVREIFDKTAILVHENSSLDIWSYSHLPVLTAGADVMPAGQTCMGFGVAGVIGAKFAMPERQALCITGDGAFQMMMDNLSVAVQYEAAPTWIILNNYSLGWIKYLQHLFHKDRFICADFNSQPDFAKIAEAHGCFGQKIQRSGEIREALQNAVKANKEKVPAVLDFVVEPFDYYPAFRDFCSATLKPQRI
jgi:acetolactate synthase-1/2/3 large subunit